MITEEIKGVIKEALSKLDISVEDILLEHPADMAHGDYSTNVAMVVAKSEKKNPKDIAEEVVRYIVQNKHKLDGVERVEVAGAGFVNFYLTNEFFVGGVKDVLKERGNFGKNETLEGKKIMVEYTDPNPFKVFHIGHLVPNAIGETLARTLEFNGADVVRADYFGDVGIHVAKSLWGVQQMLSAMPDESATLVDKTAYLGRAYALGSSKFEDDKDVAKQIKALNKVIYERSDEDVNALYDKGYKWSMEHFETIFQKLGTKFDEYYPESETGPIGLKIVEDNMDIFEESDGAVIYKGEEKGLHTRVFINSEGLPTYEAKDLGLLSRKFEGYDLDLSITVTGSEQEDYFNVVKAVMGEVQPELRDKLVTKHNGMLKLPEGKMSSRTGNVITGESILNDAISLSTEKMEANENLSESDKSSVGLMVAVAAIKYAILKQAIGKDFVFDMEKSLSFEGDSGPYLQYTYARAKSILSKGGESGLSPKVSGHEVGEVEKLIQRFPEVVLSGRVEYAPQQLVTYLTELASSFNSYYANNQVVDLNDKKESEYRLALTDAVATVIKNGLWCLGIEAPERM